MQFPADREQSQGDHRRHPGVERQRTPDPRGLQDQIERDPDDRRRGVDVTPQDQWDLAGDHVPQHPAGDTGHRPHQDDDDGRVVGGLGDLRPGEGKQPQPHRVGDQQRLARGRLDPDIRHRQQRGDDDHDQVERVGDPEDRVAIEQQIAEGAAADRRDRRDDDHAEQIQAAIAGREDAADREDRNPRQIKIVKNTFTLTRDTKTVPVNRKDGT